MANFTLGLDLGQQRDYSALVIAERVHVSSRGAPRAELSTGATRLEDAYHVRHTQRLRSARPTRP